MATKKASTLTVASGTLGVAQTIKINSESKSYRHELTVTVNGTISTLIGISSTATSLQWQPPMWWAQENTTGKTIPCHFELTTYSSSSASSAFGNVSKDIVLTIPSNSETQPDASIVSVVPVNNGIPSNISDLFIQGISKATVTCQGTAKYNATVSQYIVSIGHQGKMARSNIVTTDILQAYGKMPVTLRVRDSRGMYGTAHYDEITIQPYEKPIAVGLDGRSNVTCERCTGDGASSSSGTYLRLRAKAKFSSLAGRNTCTLQYRFKKASADWANNSWISVSGLEIDAVLNLNLNVQYAYSVEIRVVDVIGAGPTIPIEIPMDIVPLHLAAGGKNVGIGRYANTEAGTERLDVAWDSYFEKEVYFGDLSFSNALARIDSASNRLSSVESSISILESRLGDRFYTSIQASELANRPSEYSGYGRCCRWGKDSDADKYYILVDSRGRLWVGTRLDGATTITWHEK